jgi:hypothetical protein
VIVAAREELEPRAQLVACQAKPAAGLHGAMVAGRGAERGAPESLRLLSEREAA